jgi:hypothetical protein
MKTTIPPTEPRTLPDEPSTIGRIYHRSVDCAREHPGWSVLGALAVGVAVGYFIPRRRSSMMRWMESAADEAASAIRNCEDRTADAAKETVSAVGRGLRRLRFW